MAGALVESPRFIVRKARQNDFEEILEIYAHWVKCSACTFDLELSPARKVEFKESFVTAVSASTQNVWLVAEAESSTQGSTLNQVNRMVVGYAYYSDYRKRAGYSNTKETSVYVHPHYLKKGLGKLLYEHLIALAKENNVHVLLGVVGGCNPASNKLHLSLGFTEVGHLREVGRKFGEWQDSRFFQLVLT